MASRYGHAYFVPPRESPVPPEALLDLQAFIETLSTSVTESDLFSAANGVHSHPIDYSGASRGGPSTTPMSQAPTSQSLSTSTGVAAFTGSRGYNPHDRGRLLSSPLDTAIARSPSPIGQYIGSIPLEDFMPRVSNEFDTSVSTVTEEGADAAEGDHSIGSDSVESLTDDMDENQMIEALKANRPSPATKVLPMMIPKIRLPVPAAIVDRRLGDTAILDGGGDVEDLDQDQDDNDLDPSEDVSTESAEEGVNNGQFPPSEDDDDDEDNDLYEEDLLEEFGCLEGLDEDLRPPRLGLFGSRRDDKFILSGIGNLPGTTQSEVSFPHLIEDLIRSGRDPFCDVISVEEVDEHQLILRLKEMRPDQVSIWVEGRDLLIRGYHVLIRDTRLRQIRTAGEMLFERRFRFPNSWEKIHMTATEAEEGDQGEGGEDLIVKITRVTIKRPVPGSGSAGASNIRRARGLIGGGRIGRLKRMESLSSSSPPRMGGGPTGKTVTIMEETESQEDELSERHYPHQRDGNNNPDNEPDLESLPHPSPSPPPSHSDQVLDVLNLNQTNTAKPIRKEYLI